MNSANFIGRLVNTPELRQTQSGISVTGFTLAVKRPGTYGEEEKTDWIDMVAWRGIAEFICKQFEKGMPIAVRCQVQTRQKERDGVYFKETEFVIQEVEFVPRTKVKGEAVVPIAEPVVAVAQGKAEDFETVFGEDLPF
jgi:single-strand DNA-binding protein